MVPTILIVASMACTSPGLPGSPAKTEVVEPAPVGCADCDTIDGAAQWVTYAYIVGEPRDVIPVLLTADRNKLLDDRDMQRVMGVHLSVFAKEHKELFQKLVTWAPKQSSGIVRTLTLAIWWSGVDDRDELLRSLLDALPAHSKDREGIAGLLKQRTPDLKKIAPSSSILDLWWAAFFASGRTTYVDLIIDALPTPGTSLEDLTHQGAILTAGSASWSLTSNGFQHPVVLERLRTRRDEFSGKWEAVNECIEGAEAQLSENACPAPERPAEEPSSP